MKHLSKNAKKRKVFLIDLRPKIKKKNNSKKKENDNVDQLTRTVL